MDKYTSLAILVPAYLTGCVATYLFIRYYNKRTLGKWTVFDRNMAVMFALISPWVGIIIYVIATLLFPKGQDPDKPSKW